MNVIEFVPMPNEYLIDALEDLLHRALTGELQGMAYALVFSDKCTGNGWSGIEHRSMALVAELEILKQEIINEYIEMRHIKGKP